MNKPPKYHHSVLGIGKNAPANFKLLGDSKLPYGEVSDNSMVLNSLQVNESAFQYNEYCVYDVSQVKMAYLCLCDVKYHN